MDADALSQIPWENAQVDHMEPLVVKAMLQSKLVMNVEIPDVYPQLKAVQKSLVVDSSPKLTNNDWIREQSEDPNICLIIQLHRSGKLEGYTARELDSSVLHILLKYCKDLLMKKWTIIPEVLLKITQNPFCSLCYHKILCVK